MIKKLQFFLWVKHKFKSQKKIRFFGRRFKKPKFPGNFITENKIKLE